MRRVGVVVASFAVGLVAAWLGASLLVGPVADRAGREEHRHRALLTKARAAGAVAPPRVVWIGDSTILDVPGVPSWATRVRERLAESGRARGVVLAWLGLSPFHYYCLMGPVLETRPSAVVLVANLRRFGERSLPFTDLCSAVPRAELPHAMALPFLARGIAWPRLLLLRGWNVPAIAATLDRVDGLRALADASPAWDALGPPAPAFPPEEMRRRVDLAERAALAAYDLRLDERQAGVRMLGEAVRLAVAAGARVAVVVSPVPREELQARALYEPDAAPAQVATLRRVVERAGGTLVDLHDVLDAAAFSDRSGHLGADGAALVSARVEPVVSALLDARAE